MSDGNGLRETIAENRGKAVGVTAALLFAVGLIPAYDWYWARHAEFNDRSYLRIETADARYAKRDDVLVLADAENIKETIGKAQRTADSNAAKLDFLVKAAAVQQAETIQEKVDLHRLQDDGSVLWERDHAAMERKLQAAKAYRDCVIDERDNCEVFKVW